MDGSSNSSKNDKEKGFVFVSGLTDDQAQMLDPIGIDYPIGFQPAENEMKEEDLSLAVEVGQRGREEGLLVY